MKNGTPVIYDTISGKHEGKIYRILDLHSEPKIIEVDVGGIIIETGYFESSQDLAQYNLVGKGCYPLEAAA